MKKAFTVCFPVVHLTESPEDELDNPSLWEEVRENDQSDVESIQNNCRKQHLQCFAHTLQLVVRDGLKETNVLNHSLAKLTQFCSLLHSSCGLKEAFDVEYGGNRSIPSAT